MGGGGDGAPRGVKNAQMKSSFGPQALGARRTAPAFGFGTATRDQVGKVFVSQEHTALATAGTHSPGPCSGIWH